MTICKKVHGQLLVRPGGKWVGLLQICMIFAGIFLVFLTRSASADDCVGISDRPVDIRGKSPPPNIMFILDDSGSMDWEFMTEQMDGTFKTDNTTYHYLFDCDDNEFDADDGMNVLSGADRGRWKSQWAG